MISISGLLNCAFVQVRLSFFRRRTAAAIAWPPSTFGTTVKAWNAPSMSRCIATLTFARSRPGASPNGVVRSTTSSCGSCGQKRRLNNGARFGINTTAAAERLQRRPRLRSCPRSGPERDERCTAFPGAARRRGPHRGDATGSAMREPSRQPSSEDRKSGQRRGSVPGQRSRRGRRCSRSAAGARCYRIAISCLDDRPRCMLRSSRSRPQAGQPE